MTNRRFINSIVATAQTCDVQMPWHREVRAKRALRKVTVPAAKVVNIAEYRAQPRKLAA